MSNDLKPCPLCGAGNVDGDNNNVRFSPRVFGTISSAPVVSPETPPNHLFNACQMVRCNVCGCLVIDPFDAKKLWNKGRLRHARK